MEEALGNSTWNALENKKRAVYTQKLIQLQFFFKERERERETDKIFPEFTDKISDKDRGRVRTFTEPKMFLYFFF